MLSCTMHDVTHQLLQRLAEDGGFVSGARISSSLGMTRSAIWKHVAMLRRQGYGIEAVTGKGYRLASLPGKPLAAEVDPFLETAVFGRRLFWHENLSSTNLRAREMAVQGAPEGTLVAADSQTAGRGRLGRIWQSPPDTNIYCSLILRPTQPLRRIPQLTLLLAVAVHQAIADLVPKLEVAIKWPNDLLAGGRKLCGILCEMQAEADLARYVVAGIGINVNQAAVGRDLEGTATSLFMETGRRYSRPELLATFLNRFEPLYRQWQEREDDLGFVLPLLERHAWLSGREVQVDRAGQLTAGLVTGLSPEGELLLLQKDGSTVSVASGEARLMKTP